ncbi:MAG: ABC transporter substrate-binding protein, partial [Sneathiella sp.]
MNKKFIGLVSAIALLGTPALSFAADSVKIGFVTTLSTGAGAIGKDMREAVDLAVDHLGGKMAGKDIEIIYEDDGFKPEIGKQKTDKLVKKDKVDFVSGYIWSHVLMASYKSVVDSNTFLIGSNAGPSAVAGKLCHENFFSTSWQNDQTPMAMGEVLNQRGIKNLYIM